MANIIDRRKNGKGKSLENRGKLLKRVNAKVKKSLKDGMQGDTIKDMGKDGGAINVSRKSLKEPHFRHGDGGDFDYIKPGNDEFTKGKKFKRPPKGAGGGSSGNEPGDGEDGEDDFIIQITRDEFLEYFFEDLELPDLVKTNLKNTKEFKYRNAGWQSDGNPSKLSIVKTMGKAMTRELAIAGMIEDDIEELQNKIELLLQDPNHNPDEVLVIREAIKVLEQEFIDIPFIDPLDLKYHSTFKEEVPHTSAVQIMIMDNSGSMGEEEKTISRKFFGLLYLFLNRKYDDVELVFVNHTTTAKEVDEYEFFNNRENGGTLISPALELTVDIIKERYDANTHNIYVAQASDGDNMNTDNGTCYEIMVDDLMPLVQYYCYIQIMANKFEGNSMYDIWNSYQIVETDCSNFKALKLSNEDEIYSTFREFFKKKEA